MKHYLLAGMLLMTGGTWAADALPQDPETLKKEIRERMEHNAALRGEIQQRMMQLAPQEREAVMREMMSQRGMKPGQMGGFGRGYELRQPMMPMPQGPGAILPPQR